MAVANPLDGMSTAAKISAYGLALTVVFALAWALGSTAGPFEESASAQQATAAHDGMRSDGESAGAASSTPTPAPSSEAPSQQQPGGAPAQQSPEQPPQQPQTPQQSQPQQPQWVPGHWMPSTWMPGQWVGDQWRPGHWMPPRWIPGQWKQTGSDSAAQPTTPVPGATAGSTPAAPGSDMQAEPMP
ncbi:hypothetical protein OG440_39625 (plasmid) [Streptomyces sp. NBC_00637]|uniref:hypothetical protein n=1 Tax=Streptomyces sp. NBC_00637 TaxID=2903667 RepID=UPI002F91AF89